MLTYKVVRLDFGVINSRDTYIPKRTILNEDVTLEVAMNDVDRLRKLYSNINSVFMVEIDN